MGKIINHQNEDLLKSWDKWKPLELEDNHHLCDYLQLQYPPVKYRQNYDQKGIRVGVIK
jgi:hypothetical protein